MAVSTNAPKTLEELTKEVEALTRALRSATGATSQQTAAAVKGAAAGVVQQRVQAGRGLPQGGGGQRFIATDPTDVVLAGRTDKEVSHYADLSYIRYSGPNQLAKREHARKQLILEQNTLTKEAQRQAWGDRNSLDPEMRRRYTISNALRREEAKNWEAEAGLGPQKASTSQRLMGTVFSSRSLNMLSSLGDGNVMPALQTAGAAGFGMLRNMAAGTFGTGSSPLRSLFGGGGTAASQEGAGEVAGPANPDVEGAAKTIGSALEGLLAPLGGLGKIAVQVITGLAAVLTGSYLLASAMNANAANYRLGLQTSIGGIGGIGKASAHDAWKVIMDKGQSYNYTPSVAFNTAKILGENGVYGLHGAAGMGHAMDTTLAFARQANMDPTQVAPLVGKLMQGGGRDALVIDKMFQTLQNAALKANIPLARLVDSLKTLEETTNGSGISLNGMASLAKDQNAVGMGMNIGSAVAPLMSATGSSAFALSAMLTGGNMKQFMEAQGDPGKLLNLVGRFTRQTSTGNKQMDEQMAITLAQTAGVNMSGASRKSQIAMADKMLSGYDWAAHPEELKKLLSSGQNDKQAKDLAGNLVNAKDKAILDFQYMLDRLANNGFPDLTKHMDLAKTGEDMLAAAAKIASAALNRLGDAADGFLKYMGYVQPGSTVHTPDGNPTNIDVFKKYKGSEITFTAPGGAKEHLGKGLTASILMSAAAVGMDYGRLVAQGFKESNFGTDKTGFRKDYAQFDQNAIDSYNTWANSPKNNKNFFDVGKVHYQNLFYGEKYNPKDNWQGAAAMAWYDWVKSGNHTASDVVSKTPIRDQISALRHYRGSGNAQIDANYSSQISEWASHNVALHIEVVPTPHHTAKVTVVKPPKGGRNHHTPPSHRPVSQPKRHS